MESEKVRALRDAAFARHRLDQLRDHLKRTTPADRLAWLEEMIELAKEGGAMPRRDPV